MSIFSFIFDAVCTLFETIRNFVRKIVRGVMSLFRHVVSYFKSLRLRQGRDIPFIVNEQSAEFRERLMQAPVKDCGIFTATYNEDTDEIENYQSIEADEIDDDLKKTLKNDNLVVLS